MRRAHHRPATNALPSPADVLRTLWGEVGLPVDALAQVALPGREPVLATSFAVATALQASLGAAALAAAALGHARGGVQQRLGVDARDVVLEASGRFTLDGRAPKVWDKLSGLYACGGSGAPGWVRIHANFAHHRDGVLRLLGLPPGEQTERAEVLAALRDWHGEDFEQAAADAGLVVAAVRSFDQWDRHEQAAAVAAQPLVAVKRIDGGSGHAGARLPPLHRHDAAPLQGLRVLDLTRILAGPVAGRTLAAYGADVMLVNAPYLPNIESIADTSRGKLSVHVDLKTEAGRDTLRALVREADVVLQAYRPGALAAIGFGPEALVALRPGLVCLSLSAYGALGPWAGRRGFDSLVQAATGFNHAEAEAWGEAEPRALPLQALDYSAGYLLAFGAAAALLRRWREGGSWQVQVSLARTAQWLRGLGRCHDFAAAGWPSFDDAMETSQSGFGVLQAVRHAAHFSHPWPPAQRPSMPPGSHPPAWPPR
jgi:crotonobetainyl-CoA:carnitine CoA-transferase CaiB-like acyl-CoA transferase